MVARFVDTTFAPRRTVVLNVARVCCGDSFRGHGIALRS